LELVGASELINSIKPKSELELSQDTALKLGYEVVALKEQLQQKVQEVQHLRTLLESMPTPSGEVSPLLLSDIEIITRMQIDKLKQNSMSRELTLDEVKRLDLLVKNQRLVQGESTENTGSAKKTVKGKSLNEILDIAKLPLKE